MTNNEDITSAFVHRYPARTVIFEENDPGSRMYVIRSGRVRIYRRIEETEMVLAILGAGEFFGEMALLENLPRSANAQAIEDVELVEVDGETLEQMLGQNSEVAVRMMRSLAARVRELDLRLQNILVDSGVGRSIEILRWLLPKGKPEGTYVRLDASLVHIGIAAQAGMSPTEVQRVYNRLRASGCLKEDGRDVLVAGSETLDAFNSFLDLKRRYEPDNFQIVSESTELAKKRGIQRLLNALQIEPKELEAQQATLSSQYRSYLALRRRFESGRGPEG